MNLSATDTACDISTPPSREVAISVVILLTITILAGTVGNAQVCILLQRRHDFRKVPHYLLASLSVTGLLSSLIKLPAHLAVTIVNYFPPNQVSLETVCKTGFSSAMGFSVLNALTLSLMAIDRYDCVVRPFNRRLSLLNVRKVILATWVVALVSSSFYIAMLHNENCVCFRLDPYSSAITSTGSRTVVVYTMLLGTIPNVATVLLITVTVLLIVRKIRSSVLPRLRSLNRRRENQITKLTHKICAVFFISWFPVIICNIIGRIGGFHGAVFRTVKLFAVVISNFNYALNPIIHFKMLQVRLPDGVRLRSVMRRQAVTGESRVEIADSTI